MKPRIRRWYGGMWQCRGDVGHFHFDGYGTTPKAAYEDYNKLMNTRMPMGTNDYAFHKPRK